MKKTAAIIYHCIDFDGICSLAIARQHFLKRGWNVDPFPYNRGLNVPDIDLLLAYDEVVIVDIALPVKDMVDLAKCWREQGLGLCWIDHHKTSIEDSVREGYTDIPGLREPVGQGACGLCWEKHSTGTGTHSRSSTECASATSWMPKRSTSPLTKVSTKRE